jgi:maleylacetoacetate isomerase
VGIKLYSYWRSSSAYRARIALNLKELDYEIVPVSLAPGVSEHRGEEYLSRNPQGLVPFLEDDDVAIGQSMAILEYLEEVYPEIPLLPDATGAAARIRSFCNSIACDIQPLNNLRVTNYLRNEMGQDDDAVQDWYVHWIHEGFRAAEAFMQYAPESKFVYGDEPTLADVLLVPQVYNAHRFKVPLDDFPRIVEVDAHCNTLPAFIDAQPENQPDAI